MENNARIYVFFLYIFLAYSWTGLWPCQVKRDSYALKDHYVIGANYIDQAYNDHRGMHIHHWMKSSCEGTSCHVTSNQFIIAASGPRRVTSNGKLDSLALYWRFSVLHSPHYAYIDLGRHFDTGVISAEVARQTFFILLAKTGKRS